MKFERRQTFPVSAAELITLLTDKGYYEARYRMAGERPRANFDCWEETPAGLHLRIVKQIPVKADKIPVMVRGFVSSEMPFYSDFVWRGITSTAVQQTSAWVDCKFWLGNAPAHIEGSIHIRGEGDECEQHYTLELVTKIPLLSRKLKDKAIARIDKLLEEDYQATLGYIAEQS